MSAADVPMAEHPLADAPPPPNFAAMLTSPEFQAEMAALTALATSQLRALVEALRTAADHLALPPAHADKGTATPITGLVDTLPTFLPGDPPSHMPSDPWIDLPVPPTVMWTPLYKEHPVLTGWGHGGPDGGPAHGAMIGAVVADLLGRAVARDPLAPCAAESITRASPGAATAPPLGMMASAPVVDDLQAVPFHWGAPAGEGSAI